MKPLLLLELLFFYYNVSEIPYSSPACNFSAIINFGDSNSDTGGLSSTFGPTPPPYGESFFHMPTAKSFGHPFLSSNLDSLGTNYTHGVNLATAASTIIDQNTSLSQGGYSPFFLVIQVMRFSQFISRSQLVAKRGRFFESLMPKKEYFNLSLYTIDIGQNDITAGLDAEETYDEFIPQTLSAFAGEVKRIYNLGLGIS